jgi:hypothetical protein
MREADDVLAILHPFSWIKITWAVVKLQIPEQLQIPIKQVQCEARTAFARVESASSPHVLPHRGSSSGERRAKA